MKTIKTKIALGLVLPLALLAASTVLAAKGGGGGGGGGGNPNDNSNWVVLTKANYNNEEQKLIVQGEHLGFDIDMRVTVEGFVTDAPMEYQAYSGRYRYVAETADNLDGRLATITDADGYSRSATIH